MNKIRLEKELENHVIKYKENHYRLAYSYVRNVDDALDIVQEAIYKALSSINTLKNPEYLKTWYYKIVVNTALDFLRKQRKVGVMEEQTLSSIDGGVVDNYQDIDLQRALATLPEKYRSVVVLRYFEDLKIEEVADVLNENVNTVKTRLYRALKMLRIKVDDENLGEDLNYGR